MRKKETCVTHVTHEQKSHHIAVLQSNSTTQGPIQERQHSKLYVYVYANAKEKEKIKSYNILSIKG